MRMFRRAVCSALIAAACASVSRSTEAAEPSLALGPVAYEGEIPDYFQREVEQTLVHALESGDRDGFEAQTAIVILARISKRDRDYEILLTAHAVDDGAALAEVTAECSVCGQAELLDMLPVEVSRLRTRALAALSERLAPRPEVVQDEPEPMHTGRPRSVGAGLRVGGWVATWLGVGGMGAGVALLVLDGRPHLPTCPPELVDVNGACPNVYTTAGAGGAMLGIGIACLGAGIGLLVHGYRQRDRAARVQFTTGGLQLRF